MKIYYNAHQDTLICPHCRSGNRVGTLAVFWVTGDDCWRCVFCGFRGYEVSTERERQIPAGAN
jgi:hypothetical protein